MPKHSDIDVNEQDENLEYIVVDDEEMKEMEAQADMEEEEALDIAMEYGDEEGEEAKFVEGEGEGGEDDGVEEQAIGRFELHGDFVYALTLNPLVDGQVLSGGGDDTVLVWDLSDTEKYIQKLDGHTESIEYIKFNYDGKYLCTGGMNNQLRIWKNKAPEEEGGEQFTLKKVLEGPEDDLTFVSWHPKGNVLITGGTDMMLWMFNALQGEFSIFSGHEGTVTNGAFTPDGKMIVSTSEDHSVKVWGPKKGTCLRTIQSDSKFHTTPITKMLCFEDVVVTGDAEGQIYITSFASGEYHGPIAKHSNSVESLVLHDNYVISGGMDGVIKVIDIGKQDVKFETEPLPCGGGACVIKQSKLDRDHILVGSTEGPLYIMDRRNGETLKTYTGNCASIMELIELKDRVITAGDDKVVRIFDITE